MYKYIVERFTSPQGGGSFTLVTRLRDGKMWISNLHNSHVIIRIADRYKTETTVTTRELHELYRNYARNAYRLPILVLKYAFRDHSPKYWAQFVNSTCTGLHVSDELLEQARLGKSKRQYLKVLGF
jgi:hypothetical protein